MSQIKSIYLFIERKGTRLAVSALKSGENLPGAEAKWGFHSALDLSRMTEGSGIVGLGNAATILAAVRVDGLFVPAEAERT
jgi:hypothetical protein